MHPESVLKYIFLRRLLLVQQDDPGDEEAPALASEKEISSDDEIGISRIHVESDISHGLRIPEREVRCFFCSVRVNLFELF